MVRALLIPQQLEYLYIRARPFVANIDWACRTMNTVIPIHPFGLVQLVRLEFGVRIIAAGMPMGVFHPFAERGCRACPKKTTRRDVDGRPSCCARHDHGGPS